MVVKVAMVKISDKLGKKNPGPYLIAFIYVSFLWLKDSVGPRCQTENGSPVGQLILDTSLQLFLTEF